jgi:adenylosuccinate synthase
LHTRFYPQVTSSDCRAIDFLAMAGLSPWAEYVSGFEVWLVARTYPIRVAGNSGPLYRETDWRSLGLAPEVTTVTNRIRRVGFWDQDLVAEAILANGGPAPNVNLALTMLDYLVPEIAGKTTLDSETAAILDRIQEELSVAVELVGTGPATVVDLRT